VFRCALVDLDGVIRRWDAEPVAELERRHGLPMGSIASAAFGDQILLRRAITGQITDEDWRATVAERLAPLCRGSALAVVTEWSASSGAVDVDVLGVIRSARGSGWRIGVLTNATTRLRQDLIRLGLDEEFDIVVSSADLGVAKPDIAAFIAACSRLGADAQDCLFVDDSAVNVAAADKAGLSAHVFEDARQLADLLGVTPLGG
jgi:putative hydrolase of the HAD superfamily